MSNENNYGLTPEDWALLFEDNVIGQRVIEALVARFYDRGIYVKGGLEAQRETDYRAGQQSVILFMLSKINQANGVSDNG